MKFTEQKMSRSGLLSFAPAQSQAFLLTHLFGLLMLSLMPQTIGPVLAATETDKDSRIIPGKGMGPVMLGMNAAAVKESMGNIDFSYKLPDGHRVDGALWRETGKTSPIIRLFYGKTGQVVQIVEAAPALSTADGIRLDSAFSEAKLKYKNLKEAKISDATKLAYFDDSNQGICFLVDRNKQTVKAIMVHRPGAKLIADSKSLDAELKAR